MSLPPHICSAARSAGNSGPGDEDLDLDITPRPAHSLQHLMGPHLSRLPGSRFSSSRQSTQQEMETKIREVVQSLN